MNQEEYTQTEKIFFNYMNPEECILDDKNILKFRNFRNESGRGNKRDYQ